MTDSQVIKKEEFRTVILFMILLFTLIIPGVAAFGHGGKHSEAFTHLQALQKATQLYDKLINNGKLDQSWETALKKVTVSNRQKNDKKEIVVIFHRGLRGAQQFLDVVSGAHWCGCRGSGTNAIGSLAVG